MAGEQLKKSCHYNNLSCTQTQPTVNTTSNGFAYIDGGWEAVYQPVDSWNFI